MIRNISRYLLVRSLMNLDGNSAPPPAPPVVDPPPAPPAPPVVPPVAPPVVPPAIDPPPAPPVPPVDDAAAKAAKVEAIKTALKLPDGVTDADALDKTAAIASELGLSPEHAQRLLDERLQTTAATRQSVMDSYATGGSEWTKQNDAQVAAALADKDIGGGSQQKLEASAHKAKQGMAKLFGDQTAAVEKYLTDAGVASSPLLLKAFMQVADKMGEASFHRGDTPSKNAGVRDADILYPPKTPA